MQKKISMHDDKKQRAVKNSKHKVKQHPDKLIAAIFMILLARTNRKPKTIDWFYVSEMRNCRCCKKWSAHTLLNSANLHTAWQFLSVH